MYIKTLKQLKQFYDYIIIGGGSAGCVLANRLSKNPSNSVLLLEAGPSDNYIWIKIPIGYLKTIGNPRTDWCFYTNPEPYLNNRRILYARGKVLGGCSSINAMIYMRGQSQDYDSWSKLLDNDPKWNWESALGKYKQIENYIPWKGTPQDLQFHGNQGPLRVDNCRAEWEILNIWRKAAQQVAQIPLIQEFNTGNNFGSAYFQVNQNNGLRFSVSDAYLKPIQDRRNLHILKNTFVHKINFSENKVAQSVSCSVNDQDIQINVSKEVIISAGAIGSPQILQLSGIGEKSLLQKNQINLVHELQGVGENLQDHLQIRPIFKVENCQTLNTLVHKMTGKLKILLQFILQRKGPLTMPPSTLGAFGFSGEKGIFPNIEWHLQPLSLEKFGDNLHEFNAITASVCNLKPESRGFVRIKSNNRLEAPEIQCNYLKDEIDQKIALQSVKITRQIMNGEALKPYNVEEYKPGKHIQEDGELLDQIKNISTTIFHPVGTCKMGVSNDKFAVVDNKLKVYGVQGLRVADASIMPIITAGNTNAPTVFIAENCADFILGQQH